MPSEEWRLFVAITLPESVKAAIAQGQSALRRVLPGNQVRWTRSEQFHLTLKFLGNVQATRADGLAQALRAACRDFPVLRLRAEGMGFFPERGLPRVIWVGLQEEGEGALVRLQAAVERAVVEYSEEPAENSFAGHVTVGRIKGLRRSEAEALREAVAHLGQRQFGAWSADHVDLIRSELLPDGPRYRTLSAANLQG